MKQAILNQAYNGFSLVTTLTVDGNVIWTRTTRVDLAPTGTELADLYELMEAHQIEMGEEVGIG